MSIFYNTFAAQNQLEGARESAYLCQVNFCRRPISKKSVALTVLELLASYAQKLRGSRDPGHALFKKFSRGHVQTAHQI